MAYPLTAASTIAASPRAARDAVLHGDLTRVFDRRFLLLAPVASYEVGPTWGRPGGTRSVTATDGSTFVERLEEVGPGEVLAYRMERISGPLRLLVQEADVIWHFEQHPLGCRVCWTWKVQAPHRVGAALEPLFRLQWQRYAANAMRGLRREVRQPTL